jgi:hypothetical protein
MNRRETEAVPLVTAQVQRDVENGRAAPRMEAARPVEDSIQCLQQSGIEQLVSAEATT